MKRVAIIGAGLSGLFIANLFKGESNYKITIYEKGHSVNLDEGYGIQLSVNSIKILNKIKFDTLKDDEKFNPDKINFYSNDNLKKICELKISDFNSTQCKYTTLKRSTLINFLKKDLDGLIKTNYSISKIKQKNELIQLSFENNETNECDYLIISDGVFSKSKNLISNNQIKPRFNNTLAIRGMINNHFNLIDDKNISLFLGSNYHHVIYPVNPNGDLNFISVLDYKLSHEEQKNYSLLNEDYYLNKILDKITLKGLDLRNILKKVKIFPIFVSKNFYKKENNNIHLIGDAFFAFPPSFAQGASQSIEGAYELFKSIENKTENIFFKNRVKKTKMVNIRSKLNQFIFHLSNSLIIFLRNIVLKKLVKNKLFLKTYLGKIYKN